MARAELPCGDDQTIDQSTRPVRDRLHRPTATREGTAEWKLCQGAQAGRVWGALPAFSDIPAPELEVTSSWESMAPCLHATETTDVGFLVLFSTSQLDPHEILGSTSYKTHTEYEVKETRFDWLKLDW